jgi:hypothetical protein
MTPPTISAAKLRKLAEAADGQRDQDMVLVLREDEYELVKAEEVRPPDRTNLSGLTVRTRTGRPAGSPTLSQVTIMGEDVDGERNVHADLDALFWSESAIEKFVVPYYSRLLDPTDLKDLWDAHLRREVYGIGHCCYSIYTPLTDIRDSINLVVRASAASVDQAPTLQSFRDWKAAQQ